MLARPLGLLLLKGPAAVPEAQARVLLVEQRADRPAPEWAVPAQAVAQAGSKIRRVEGRAELFRAVIGTTAAITISDTYG